MNELLYYLDQIKADPKDIDRKAWVDVDTVLDDSTFSRDEVFFMANKAKTKGLILWMFYGFFSSNNLKRISISKKGRNWLKKSRLEKEVIIPESSMKVHQLR